MWSNKGTGEINATVTLQMLDNARQHRELSDAIKAALEAIRDAADNRPPARYAHLRAPTPWGLIHFHQAICRVADGRYTEAKASLDDALVDAHNLAPEALDKADQQFVALGRPSVTDLLYLLRLLEGFPVPDHPELNGGLSSQLIGMATANQRGR